METNYYEILGLEQTATAEQIKHSYRKLARLYHPDVNNSPDAEKKMRLINQAYNVLSDPTARQKYDRFLQEEQVEVEAEAYEQYESDDQYDQYDPDQEYEPDQDYQNAYDYDYQQDPYSQYYTNDQAYQDEQYSDEEIEEAYDEDEPRPPSRFSAYIHEHREPIVRTLVIVALPLVIIIVVLLILLANANS